MKSPIATAGLATIILLAAATWLVPAVMVSGCGKKAMPEPPSGSRPPGVADLSYSISDHVVTLSWAIPETTVNANSPVSGFFIYRAKQSGVEADCPDCPIHFQRIGDVLVRRGTPQEPEVVAIYTQHIEPGYRYIYKVISYDNDGVTGRDSNLVDFRF